MMTLEFQLELSLYALLSALLGAVIGINREREGHPAGLRTYMLVAVGSCLFTSLSMHAFPGGDQGRVAAQIVSGIGFLGAGILIVGRKSREVKNVTTAAGIWVVAAIGMAVGAGAWLLAMCVTLLVWLILAILKRIVPQERDKDISPALAADPAGWGDTPA